MKSTVLVRPVICQVGSAGLVWWLQQHARHPAAAGQRQQGPQHAAEVLRARARSKDASVPCAWQLSPSPARKACMGRKVTSQGLFTPLNMPPSARMRLPMVAAADQKPALV